MLKTNADFIRKTTAINTLYSIGRYVLIVIMLVYELYVQVKCPTNQPWTRAAILICCANIFSLTFLTVCGVTGMASTEEAALKYVAIPWTVCCASFFCIQSSFARVTSIDPFVYVVLGLSCLGTFTRRVMLLEEISVYCKDVGSRYGGRHGVIADPEKIIG